MSKKTFTHKTEIPSKNKTENAEFFNLINSLSEFLKKKTQGKEIPPLVGVELEFEDKKITIQIEKTT